MHITLSNWLLVLALIFLSKLFDLASSISPVLLANYTGEFKRATASTGGDVINLNYRLPNETYPEHYNIQLTTNIHTGEKSFQGEITIDIVVAKATNCIILHARQLEISKVIAALTSTGETEELSHIYESEREFLILTRKTNKKLFAETKWKVSITYSGKLCEELEGFYWSKYMDDARKIHYLATTYFGGTNARYAFPCYDEPNKRANFTITINHSPTYTAISNMPVNKVQSSAGRTVFLTTPRMPTYIVGFVVFDFEYTEGVLNGLTQRVYSRPNAKNLHKFALVSGMLLLDYFTEYFNIEFMLPKIDHVAVPDFPVAAMENWGVITYHEGNLLNNENTSTAFLLNRNGITIAHELAHQWIGDFVTIKCWGYVWITEGLATLFAYFALDHIYPEWDIWQKFHASCYQHALKRDSLISNRPLTSYAQTPKEISSLSDYNSYDKAASVLLMWNNALTEKVFQRGLRNLMKQNQYSAVGEEELFTALHNAVEEEHYEIPAPINEMIGTWTHQGGYPVLTVTRNYENGTFTIKQETYHDDETIIDAQTWYVPINFAVASNPDFRNTEATHYLLNVTEMTVDDVRISKSDWLLLNKQSNIYCRINYDEQNWNLIAESLIQRPYTFHYRNRAQLIDDTHRFSVSNRLDYVTHLKVLSYLKHEDQFAPWNTAFDILEKYNRYFKGHQKYDDFKFFVNDLVSPIYKKLGVNKVAGEHHYHVFTRQLIIKLACAVGVQECLRETNNKLKDIIYKKINIDSSLKYIVLCNGLRQASDALFNNVYQQLLHFKGFRGLLIDYLSYTENKNQIKKFIYSSIDKSNSLRPEERYALLQPTYSNGGLSLLTCIEFLIENWNAYGNLKKYGSNPLNDDILGMASYVVNRNQEEKLLDLVNKVKNSKHVTSSLETSVKEKIKENSQWLWKYGEVVMTWISQYRADNDNGGSAPTTASRSSLLL